MREEDYKWHMNFFFDGCNTHEERILNYMTSVEKSLREEAWYVDGDSTFEQANLVIITGRGVFDVNGHESFSMTTEYENPLASAIEVKMYFTNLANSLPFEIIYYKDKDDFDQLPAEKKGAVMSAFI